MWAGNLYTVGAAAQRLGVSCTTIRRWSDRRWLRAVRTNDRGDRLFSPAALADFVRDHPESIPALKGKSHARD